MYRIRNLNVYLFRWVHTFQAHFLKAARFLYLSNLNSCTQPLLLHFLGPLEVRETQQIRPKLSCHLSLHYATSRPPIFRIPFLFLFRLSDKMYAGAQVQGSDEGMCGREEDRAKKSIASLFEVFWKTSRGRRSCQGDRYVGWEGPARPELRLTFLSGALIIKAHE